MAAMTFGCPHCQMQMSLDDQYAGMQIQCPGCRMPFGAPNPRREAAAAAAPPPPPMAPGAGAAPGATGAIAAGPGYTIRAMEAPPVSGTSIWKTARIGFGVLMLGYFGYIVSAAAGFLAVVFIIDKNLFEAGANLLNVCHWAGYSGTAFALLGSGIAIAAPADGGVKAPAAIALVMFLTGLGLHSAMYFGWTQPQEALFYITAAALALGPVIVMIAVKAAADRFCKAAASFKCIINIIVLIVLYGGAVAVGVTLYKAGANRSMSQGMAGFVQNMIHVLPAGFLMYYVWTFFLIGKVKNSLGRMQANKPKFGSYLNR